MGVRGGCWVREGRAAAGSVVGSQVETSGALSVGDRVLDAEALKVGARA